MVMFAGNNWSVLPLILLYQQCFWLWHNTWRCENISWWQLLQEKRSNILHYFYLIYRQLFSKFLNHFFTHPFAKVLKLLISLWQRVCMRVKSVTLVVLCTVMIVIMIMIIFSPDNRLTFVFWLTTWSLYSGYSHG